MKSTIFKEPKIQFDPNKYVTKQVWFTSKDGTKVPMFITMKKGTKLTGKNPTLLYGYGGFNISQVPQFSVSRAMLLDMGGIYAVANIRGGGEFGESWHKAGTKDKKQNVFDDFIAAAEYLIKTKYTSNDYLAIQGGSNGGLLVGACMTQRPELYKVALPAVGVLDMLRYHRFTIGRAWAVDYGLSEDEKGFDFLYKYSPLQNIKKGTPYPATLVTTGDHDDRVVPAHSFKFAAALQEAQSGKNPALIRIETSAGHGAGKPTSKLIEETADVMSFMFFNMGINIKWIMDNG
jgi:prolyl oligopeptidase